jgi:hypothetical protein
MRRRLGARIGKRKVLAHDELEHAAQRGLDRGDADLAVALRPVTVAAGE